MKDFNKNNAECLTNENGFLFEIENITTFNFNYLYNNITNLTCTGDTFTPTLIPTNSPTVCQNDNKYLITNQNGIVSFNDSVQNAQSFILDSQILGYNLAPEIVITTNCGTEIFKTTCNNSLDIVTPKKFNELDLVLVDGYSKAGRLCQFNSTCSPTSAPTDSPIDVPTDSPTDMPSNSSSNYPSNAPTNSPSDNPTR